jgi:hypothetical protein
MQAGTTFPGSGISGTPDKEEGRRVARSEKTIRTINDERGMKETARVKIT